MTSTLTTEPNTMRASRPRPGPGHRIAPPAPDSFAPWVALFDQPFTSGRCHWVMGADGALIPVPVSEEVAASQTKRKAFAGRVTALLRR